MFYALLPVLRCGTPRLYEGQNRYSMTARVHVPGVSGVHSRGLFCVMRRPVLLLACAAAFFLPDFALYLAFHAVDVHHLVGIEEFGIPVDVFLL